MELTLPEKLLNWIKSDSLPLPPLPTDLAGDLEEEDEFMFATRPGRDWPPFMGPERAGFALLGLQEEGAAAETEGPPEPGFLRLGVVGHGLQSWRFHYLLRRPGFGFALELPYGNAFSDTEQENAELEHGFRLARLCLEAAEADQGRGWYVLFSENICRFRRLSPEGALLNAGENLGALLNLLGSRSEAARNQAQEWVRV